MPRDDETAAVLTWSRAGILLKVGFIFFRPAAVHEHKPSPEKGKPNGAAAVWSAHLLTELRGPGGRPAGLQQVPVVPTADGSVGSAREGAVIAPVW